MTKMELGIPFNFIHQILRNVKNFKELLVGMSLTFF